MLNTDILIVGAGPIGTYLAEKLASKGISVLVIDKKKEIGKHACSGLVSTRLDSFVELEESLIEHKIKGSIFNSKKEKFAIKKDEVQAYVLDRVAFDQFMAKRAEASGAKILTDTPFLDYEIKDKMIYASTPNETIRSKLLIGCDGAGSPVRKKSGLDSGQLTTVNGIIGYTDEKNNSDLVELFYGKDIAPGFFAWKIPRGNRTEYGLASGKDHIEHFNRFISDHKIDKTYTHPICFGHLESTVADNVLLLGDAALQVKPFSGGGIIYGLMCADIAVEVIENAFAKNSFDKSVLLDYDKRWRQRLKDKIDLGLGIRKTLDSLSDKELDTFFLMLLKNKKDIETSGDMDFL
ncbi:MAG: NAD(P)/FAD-dependent oxidoreductase [Candidatus Aenigmarchaeota archaeon]|nr:NAD(P)/FAD-dependent oxidoreductase [Candidatus Aenigmarchaeota archaeon]